MLYAQVIHKTLNKEQYNRFSKYLNKDFFGGDTKSPWWGIFQRIASYHEDHEKDLSLETLRKSHFLSMGAMSKQATASLEAVYELIEGQDDVEEADFLLEQVRRRGIMQSVVEALEKELEDGKPADLIVEADKLQALDADDDSEELTYTIDLREAAEDYEASRKWKWFSDELDQLVQGAGPERNCLVVALTNVGKTSFVTKTCIEFMRQGAKTLHFAIAEDSKVSLQRRYYQAAFKATDIELDESVDSFAERFVGEFGELLRLAPVDSLTIGQAEELIKREKPDIVVFDDFKDIELGRQGKGEMKDHKLHGIVAVRIKSLSIKYGFFAICCAQAADSATGKKWLERADIADSKVDIPAKFQFVIGISRGESGAHDLRYFSLIKNKLGEEGDRARFTLNIDEARCNWT